MRHPYKTALLLIGDIIILYVSLFAMLLVRYGSITDAPLFKEHIIPFSILFVLWVVVFYIHNLYDLTAAKNTLEFFNTLGRAVLINLILAITLFYFIPFFGITPKRNLFITLAFFAILFSLWRQGINRSLKRHFRQGVLLAGPLAEVSRLARVLEKNPQIGYRVSLVFTEKKPGEPTPFVVHTPDEFSKIATLARQYRVQTVIVAKGAYRNARVVGELEKLLSEDIEIISLDEVEERIYQKIELNEIDELWFFDHFAKNRRATYGILKRAVDLLAVLVFAVPALLLIIITAALVKFQDRGPVLYKQIRVGQYGKPFTLLKFRTMTTDAEKKGPQLTIDDDPRVTRIGRFLRKTRVDELPQFVNILKGEMSFVGPRSERPEFDERFVGTVPFYNHRYLIKPGATGWAQINYSSVITLEDAKQRLAYDFFYLKNRSLIFDIGIILKTLDLMLRGSGR